MSFRRIMFVLVAFTLPLLAACTYGGGPYSGGSTPPPGHVQQLYVTDGAANAIYIFALTATGAAAPTRTIQGVATTLNSPVGIAVDSSGNIYVANEGGLDVLEFAAAASGNVAPIKTIGGASTGFMQPRAIAVDASANIYVGDPSAKSVWIFTAAQTGNVVPNASITGLLTTLNYPGGLAVDATGKVYVGDHIAQAIKEWNPGHTGNVAPDNVITSVPGAYGLQLANGNIYTGGQFGGHLEVYPMGATGAAVPTQDITGPATTLTGLTRGAAADAAGNTYAANAAGGVPRFASGVTGNTAPTTILTVPTDAEGVTIF